MGSKPKAPKPTQDEIMMRQRQTEEMARLDNEENTRLKRLLRNRSGGRSLLKGPTRSLGGGSSGGSAPAAKGSVPSLPSRGVAI